MGRLTVRGVFRRIGCLFALLAVLPMCGCRAVLEPACSIEETAVSPSSDGFETEETTGELPCAYEAGVKARLAALPVASEEMPVSERRCLCVDFARLQCSFQWTPTHTFRVEYTSGVNTFKEGVVYGGVPYSQSSSSLYAMLDLYDEKTGALLTAPFVRGQSFTQHFGNDCADSLFWAWARVSGSIRFTLTTGMDQNAGCIKLGDYEYDVDQGYFAATTRGICRANGEQVMFRSYAACQAADGIVMNNQSKSAGNHARMVAEEAHVAYLPDGSIDGQNSYLVCIEQKSSFSPMVQDGKIVQAQGSIDRKYSFAVLYLDGYIPFQIGEVAGLKPVEKAEAHLEGEASAQGFPDLAVVSNYRIAKITFTLTDTEGHTVFDKIGYGYETHMYRLPVESAVLSRGAVSHLAPGDYHLTVTALVGSGETLTAYDGPFHAE